MLFILKPQNEQVFIVWEIIQDWFVQVGMKSCKFLLSPMSPDPWLQRKAKKCKCQKHLYFFPLLVFLEYNPKFSSCFYMNNSTQTLSHRFLNFKLCIMHTSYLTSHFSFFLSAFLFVHYARLLLVFAYKSHISLVFWFCQKKKLNLYYDSASSQFWVSSHILFLIKTNYKIWGIEVLVDYQGFQSLLLK